MQDCGGESFCCSFCFCPNYNLHYQVSSPEEVAVERRENDVMRGEEEVLKEVAKVGKEDMLAKAKEDQLAKAHQDVIAQMREAMLEARGGTKVGTGGERERWEISFLEIIC